MSSQSSLVNATKGSHTVFLVTNFYDTMSKEGEYSQGKAVTDACKECGVQHLIFSSLRSVQEVTAGKLRHVNHFESKAQIEQYIRESGVPATFVLPGFFMSNLTAMVKRQGDTLMLAWPVDPDKAQFPLFDLEEDTGKIVTILYEIVTYLTSLLWEKEIREIRHKTVSRHSRQTCSHGY